jgi:hypothetical protein
VAEDRRDLAGQHVADHAAPDPGEHADDGGGIRVEPETQRLDGPFDAEQAQPHCVEHEHRPSRQPPAPVRPEDHERPTERDRHQCPVGERGGWNCADEHVPQDAAADRGDDAERTDPDDIHPLTDRL